MALIDIFKITPLERRLYAIEKASLVYNFITTVLILIFVNQLHHPATMLLERLGILVLMGAAWGLYSWYPSRITAFVRMALQMGLLAYWYPDTFEFNRLLPNIDPVFAQADQLLFGCQPSLIFSQLFPSLWVSEAFNMGYFLYYPMIAVVAFYYFFFRPAELEKVLFILIASFFIYYLIYIVLPVAGPQFYFRAIGLDKVKEGIFPWVGDYFNHHTFLIKRPLFDEGFFYRLVESSQEVGERPTAAFPSSHVGVSTICMLLSWRANRKLTYSLLLFYLLLCGATVYIQAHYLVDAIAGFFSALLLYKTTAWLYDKIEAKTKLSGTVDERYTFSE
ncbi:MAG: phosphatase PAP2 family protein [Phocaeicola sp.]|nr:phosphatase PAP2 family protein [Phocaeicola sp.]MDY3913634.1 phosphatase PAP2 family protein [Phocaeicola sp.]